MIGGPLLAGFLFQIKNFLPFIISAIALFAAFIVMKTCCNSKEEGYDTNQIVPESL
jgi:hypothetical protein